MQHTDDSTKSKDIKAGRGDVVAATKFNQIMDHATIKYATIKSAVKHQII